LPPHAGHNPYLLQDVGRLSCTLLPCPDFGEYYKEVFVILEYSNKIQ